MTETPSDDGSQIISPRKSEDLPNIMASRSAIRKAVETRSTPSNTCEDLMYLVDMMEGAVPSSFHKVFLFAQYLERTVGEHRLDEILCPAPLSEEDSPPDDSSPRLGAVQGGYTVSPQQREAETLSDLALLPPFDLMRMTTSDLVRQLQSRELIVDDLVLEGRESEVSKTISNVTDDDKGLLKSTEQSLYILIDLSWSMRESNRLLFAQTLALWYLNTKYNKQKQRPRLFLRGFAISPGELVRANHMEDLPQVVEEILGADAHQKGTDHMRAFLQASADIKFEFPITQGADILMITDGLGVIDVPGIRENFPKGSKLHVVKLGNDIVSPMHGETNELMAKFPSMIEGKDQEQVEETINQIYNERLTKQWQDLADNLIELPDIQEIKPNSQAAQEIEDFLNANVYITNFFNASDSVKRHAVFFGDLLGRILKHDGKNMEEKLREKFKKIQLRLMQWIAGGVEIDIEAVFAKAKKTEEVKNLRPGKQKTPIALSLTRGKSLAKVFVDKKKLFIKLLYAILRKLRLVK